MMIRKAAMEDMPAILKVYEAARAYMVRTGNPTQWGTTEPRRELLEEDICRGQLYAMCGEDGAIHAAFAFVMGEDPTYAVIEEGDWTSDEPYGTIHRLGSDGTLRGVVPACFAFCRTIIPCIRVDTHHDNLTMQHQVEKCGFRRCGVVHVYDGTPRIAYQYTDF